MLVEKEEKILDFTEAVLLELTNKHYGSFGQEMVDEFRNELIQIENETRSEMYFIMIAGGIKSGKSSLINLLSREEVAKTQLGQETTLRPSIISRGNEDKIIVYYRSDSNEKEALNAAISHIKGFDQNSSGLKKYGVRAEPIEFTVDNTYKYTATNQATNSQNIILVNIRINTESSIFQENIAIIDTPGIDGNKATVNNPITLLDRTDYLLFLQSSVSPLNISSSKFLEKIQVETVATPTRLVHNKFSLKQWRKVNGSEADIKSIENALKLLEDNLNRKDISAIVVDIGKAEDGLSKDSDILEANLTKTKKELLDESDIFGLESDLKNIIRDTCKTEHIKKQYGLLEQKISGIRKRIYEEAQRHKQNKEKLKNSVKEEFTKVKKQFEDMSNSAVLLDDQNSGYKAKVEIDSKTFKDEIKDAIEKAIENAINEPFKGLRDKFEKDSLGAIKSQLVIAFDNLKNDEAKLAFDMEQFNKYIQDKVILSLEKIKKELENEEIYLSDIAPYKLSQQKRDEIFHYPSIESELKDKEERTLILRKIKKDETKSAFEEIFRLRFREYRNQYRKNIHTIIKKDLKDYIQTLERIEEDAIKQIDSKFEKVDQSITSLENFSDFLDTKSKEVL